jgi:hypothetical protein
MALAFLGRFARFAVVDGNLGGQGPVFPMGLPRFRIRQSHRVKFAVGTASGFVADRISG